MKENRTYDQVFGDLKQGNGDPSLTLFGRDVTPNQHALAEQFVLLDNLYCSGEVSQDGQPWTTSAYATEFTQRAWTLSYSKHGALDHRRRHLRSVDALHLGAGEAARPQGDDVRHGQPPRRRRGPQHAVRAANLDPQWSSGPPARRRRARATSRAPSASSKSSRRWIANGTVPNFMFMALGENHTQGTTPGAYTPKAQVASNDVAVGKIVEAITKSRVWPRIRDLHHRRRCAERPGSRGLAPHRRSRHQPLREARRRRQRDVFDGQHAADGGAAARPAADDAARRRRAADGEQLHGETGSVRLHGAAARRSI